jgi:hypothetical protein
MRRLPFFFALSLFCLGAACAALRPRPHLDPVGYPMREPDMTRVRAVAAALVEGDGYRYSFTSRRKPAEPPFELYFLLDPAARARQKKELQAAEDKRYASEAWDVLGDREYSDRVEESSRNFLLRLIDWRSLVTHYHRDSVWVGIRREGSDTVVYASGIARQTTSTALTDDEWARLPVDPLSEWSAGFPVRLYKVLAAAAPKKTATPPLGQAAPLSFTTGALASMTSSAKPSQRSIHLFGRPKDAP